MAKTSDEIWPPPRLIRAARALAGIDQATLAKKARVSRKTVVKIEGDESAEMDPRRLAALQKLRRALEDHWHVEFFAESKQSGEGVRFRKR